jgi:murein DD-endopeptidase MepM/ murein hydrolase activator NlpD
MIKIRHNKKYSSIYGHMSHFSKHFHLYSHVKQGQVIGYVGQTGMATGPHLHYELRIYGVPHNPVTVHLPNAAPVPAKNRKAYMKYIRKLREKLGDNLIKTIKGVGYKFVDNE